MLIAAALTFKSKWLGLAYQLKRITNLVIASDGMYVQVDGENL